MGQADAYTWGLDLDGVIWSGTEPIAGSAEAVADLRGAGHDVVFVTNNSFSTIAQQESKLGSFGIDASGSVITSAQAAASLVEPGERALVLGGPGVIEAFCPGPGPSWPRLRRQRARRQSLPANRNSPAQIL